MNSRVFQHPMVVLLSVGAFAALAVGAIDLLYGMSFGMMLHADDAGRIIENPNRLNWAKLIASVIWIGGCGAGVVGALIYGTRAYRLNKTSLHDASLIHELSPEEYSELDRWISAGHSQFKG